MIPKIQNSELVLIKQAASDSGNRFYFPDVQNIRNVKTQMIEFYFAELIPSDPNLNALQPFADVQKGYLVLSLDGGEYIKRPLLTFIQIQNTTATATGGFMVVPVVFDDIVVNWPKSYVVLNAAATSATKTWMFNVSYTPIDPR